MAVSSGNLNGLLNQVFPVDTGFYGVNYVSGATSGQIQVAGGTLIYPIVLSVSVALNGLAGTGTINGIGEQVKVVSVNDATNQIGIATGVNGQFTSITEEYTVLGVDAGTGAILLTGLNYNFISAAISSGTASNASLANDLDILSPGALGSGATISFPGLTAGSAPTGVLASLSIPQQLELIYIAYFNRAADGAGDTFWGNQNAQAQAQGQGATLALTNVANSFAPQSETVTLYPFLQPLLSGGPINLNTPANQTGLANFINSVYVNLFSRSADAAGSSYWVQQITSGSVGLGAAALAIANGATGNDASQVQNKITVALDFTTRTNAAGIGQTSPLPSSLVPEARIVLSNVDGVSLNDASVTAAETLTTNYIAHPAAAQMVGAMEAATTAIDPAVITITSSDQLIDPGMGNHTIQFLPSATDDTVTLHMGGIDHISGFDPGSDALNVGNLLRDAGLDSVNTVIALTGYVTVVSESGDAMLNFDPTGSGGGSTVAVLSGLGGGITSLASLERTGAVQLSA